MVTTTNRQAQSLYLLMVLSGFAGLGYQIVWTRMLSVALGHEIVAILAVVAAFFTGLALGAFSLDGIIRRSQVPGRWYAALELLIGIWALALVFLIPEFNQILARFVGPEPSLLRHWVSTFIGTFLLLLPATAAMGGTLPAMERLFSALRQDGWSVGGLYGANTFGAVAGTIITTFLLAPWFGFTTTLLVLAAINVICALAVYTGAARGEAGRPPVAFSTPDVSPRYRLMMTLFITGLLGIGYEVLVIRVMSQVLENTIYTFASLLSVYLLGTALGAALYHRYAPRQDFNVVLSKLLQFLSLTCLIGVGLLWTIESFNRMLVELLGNGTLVAVAGEFAIAVLIFLLPTLVMGATFSHLAQGSRDSLGLGRALGLNTLGAALAPLLFGVVLLPLLGSKTALLLVCFAYLLLMPWQSLRQRWLSSAIPAAIAVILLLAPWQLQFVRAPEGGEVLSYKDGVMASVSVIRDAGDVRFLKVNNHYTMGSSASSFSDRRQAHIPLLLHPDPKEALFLGLGTGSTFITAAAHPDLNATAVELIPEILPLVEYFGPSLEQLQQHDRIHVLTGDARRFVRSTQQHYDVIIAEVFHPSRDGAGSLYTVEHFQAIRERLKEQGIFCQWLPLFQLDLHTLQTITRTFVSVFPEARAYLAHYSLGQPLIALVGHMQATSYTPGWLASRVNDRDLAEDLTRLRLDSDFALFGGLIADSAGLKQFAGDGQLNTDDHPVVTFQAPDFVYGGPEPAWKRLLALVDQLHAEPDDLILTSAGSDAVEFSQRLAAYWDARDAYLKAGVGVQPSNDTRAMLEQVGRPLLSIVRMSKDFSPAYQPLLYMAYELYGTDPDMAQVLLKELEDANPARRDASQLRQRLFGQ